MSTTIVATNKKQEGRSVYIKSNPTVGLLALTSFADDANGPIGPIKFIKTFRYTTNGVQYSDWINLTVANITAIQVDPKKPFVVEIAYFKDEPTGPSVLDVTEATIIGTSAADPLTPLFDNSLFKKYFNSNDQEVLNWYVNVLEKLWNKGLLPNFLTKDPLDPDDFLAMWSAVARFFAYYVVYARTFSTFYNNYDILTDFLGQRGLNVSPEDTLPQLQELLRTFYYQMSQRGTWRIIEDYQLDALGYYGGGLGLENIDESVPYNGEMLRLIHYKAAIDEFLWVLYEPQNFGWCLGHSSPLYKGLRVNDQLNKAPWSHRYTSMAHAGTYATNGSITTDTDGNTILRMDSGGGSVGVASGVKADPNLDYEFSFQIKLAAGKKLTFDINGFDVEGGSVALLSRRTGTPVGHFFASAVLSRSDKYVTVRGYLYNKNRPTFSADTTNIRQGANLLADPALNNIGFTISTDGAADIFDFKILPVQTSYSRGLTQVTNFISAWLNNRNNIYSTLELEAYVDHYLIPYNSKIKLHQVGDFLYEDDEQDIDSTYWAGAGEYCRKTVWIGADPACETTDLIWIADESFAYCEQVDGSVPPPIPAVELDFNIAYRAGQSASYTIYRNGSIILNGSAAITGSFVNIAEGDVIRVVYAGSGPERNVTVNDSIDGLLYSALFTADFTFTAHAGHVYTFSNPDVAVSTLFYDFEPTLGENAEFKIDLNGFNVRDDINTSAVGNFTFSNGDTVRVRLTSDNGARVLTVHDYFTATDIYSSVVPGDFTFVADATHSYLLKMT